MRVKYELMSCIDCLMVVANGEYPEDPTNNIGDRIMANLGDDRHHLCCGDSDLDQEFSWSACQCCRSPLGGSRHQLIVLECE